MEDRVERRDEERSAHRPPMAADDWFVGGDNGHVDGAALGAAIELRKLRLAA